jgi:hypothetical protein
MNSPLEKICDNIMLCTSIKPVGKKKPSKEHLFCTQCFTTWAKHDNGDRMNHCLQNIFI